MDNCVGRNKSQVKIQMLLLFSILNRILLTNLNFRIKYYYMLFFSGRL